MRASEQKAQKRARAARGARGRPPPLPSDSLRNGRRADHSGQIRGCSQSTSCIIDRLLASPGQPLPLAF
eukprot:3743131-Pleurochrysis_carterae.AAC.1